MELLLNEFFEKKNIILKLFDKEHQILIYFNLSLSFGSNSGTKLPLNSNFIQNFYLFQSILFMFTKKFLKKGTFCIHIFWSLQ